MNAHDAAFAAITARAREAAEASRPRTSRTARNPDGSPYLPGRLVGDAAHVEFATDVLMRVARTGDTPLDRDTARTAVVRYRETGRPSFIWPHGDKDVVGAVYFALTLGPNGCGP